MKIGVCALLLFFCGCAPFQDSPFSDQLLRRERSLNVDAVSEVSGVEADGKIRIAVIADSHQNYKDLDLVVDQINKTADLDFIVNLGDMTNMGYNLEFDQFIDSLVDFKRPVISVIGNHDSLGNGPSLFSKAFGPSNFYFESDTKRFVFFNSANLENPDAFDPAWLKARVDESTKPVWVFSHVQLRDPERFSGDVAALLGSIIESPKVQFIANGHNHIYDLGYDHDTVMLQAPRVEGARWLLLEMQGNRMSVTPMDTGDTAWVGLKP